MIEHDSIMSCNLVSLGQCLAVTRWHFRFGLATATSKNRSPSEV
jgi:hypothetical protein